MTEMVTNEDYWMHVLRNPYGHSEDSVRRARLWAADLIESLRRDYNALLKRERARRG